ncbi:replication restart helicase PriA [Capillimicrobium parvum]|uniref:Replication restart protein PriA n=1 Tax=Capillimicrobium parvum TaxID=2884022 RepID=A0A9E7C0R3_9ACTN|nr:primosomal protein N' [Capillimicrobium parvum]UGS35802.1 Primosomal protein N' [Capillimicrobium parvum]
MSRIARVEPLTTARALRGPFDYLRPDGAEIGSLLVVPFGRRDVTGVVTGLADRSEVAEDRLMPARRVLPHSVPPELVELAEWMAVEYCSTFARALGLMLPPSGTREKTALWAERNSAGAAEGVRLTDRQRELLASLPRLAGPDLAALRRLERRGLVRLALRAQRRAPEHAQVGARRPQPALTAAQAAALRDIEAAAPGERLLLHGVTGSGKTEVYLRAVGACLERGEGAIVLVPEIALTPQIVSRFAERFGDTVAVLHSALGAGERHDEWLRLRRGQARVCVGPRSAVFAPIDRLGLIVIDEEHDSSYKHEGDPRYDARLVAERRGCRVVAGSATPRPESYHAMRRIVLAERVDGQALPPVQVLDMREQRAALHPQTFSALLDAPKSIVLLNRRGWSNFLSCRTCGRAWGCPQCDVTLVLHRGGGYLACHHCGHRERVPDRCPDCGSVSVTRHGAGTERLESDLAGAGLRAFRLDADVARAGSVLRAFEAAGRGVLVGTQVVAKGHDFPDVTLGVVLDADATLRFPDFRAEERTFALVAQLAGRAGRGPGGGRVLVQTLAPDAESIRCAARHDADTFLAGELRRREALRYPPFSTLIRVVCSSERPGLALDLAGAIHARLPGALGPAPLFRLRGRERAQVVVKAADRRAAIAAVGAAVAAEHRRGAAISVDVDPQ